MMMPMFQPISATGFASLATTGVLALVLTLLLAALLVPSLLSPGARPEGAVRALFNYLMQAVGIVLMMASGFPAVLSVLTGASFAPQSYLFLLIVFATGGLTFLWYEQHIAKIDQASRAVPSLLFHSLFKFLGYFTTFTASLTIVATVLFAPEAALSGQWWPAPLLLLAFGVFLLWCTASPVLPRPFRSEAMNGAQRPASKIAAKKKK